MFGRLLADRRRALGRSQQRVAEQLCAVSGAATVSRHEVSRWERGLRLPTPYWRAAIGRVLGVPLPVLDAAAARARRERARSRARAPAARAGDAGGGRVRGPGGHGLPSRA
jgi:transcriptional regulator with XRE-family HTH domain